MQQKYIEYLRRLIPLYGYYIINNELVIKIASQHIEISVYFLQKHTLAKFKGFSFLTAVDYPQQTLRFALIYELVSFHYNTRIRLKCSISEKTNMLSIAHVYLGANWSEREVWDMFGIFFVGHPDLRRILTDYGFEGYPLRKDFPVTGYYELRYDDSVKRLVCDALTLAQYNRLFEHKNPWLK